MYWIALAALMLAAVLDVRSREIPNGISVSLLVLALAAKAFGLHPVSWGEIGLGFGAALLISSLLFFMGGLGGGDVKLLSALGAVLGASAFLPFILLTTVFGGFFAWRAKKRGATEIAYAPAMFAGLFALLPLVLLSR